MHRRVHPHLHQNVHARLLFGQQNATTACIMRYPGRHANVPCAIQQIPTKITCGCTHNPTTDVQYNVALRFQSGTPTYPERYIKCTPYSITAVPLHVPFIVTHAQNRMYKYGALAAQQHVTQQVDMTAQQQQSRRTTHVLLAAQIINLESHGKCKKLTIKCTHRCDNVARQQHNSMYNNK